MNNEGTPEIRRQRHTFWHSSSSLKTADLHMTGEPTADLGRDSCSLSDSSQQRLPWLRIFYGFLSGGASQAALGFRQIIPESSNCLIFKGLLFRNLVQLSPKIRNYQGSEQDPRAARKLGINPNFQGRGSGKLSGR